MSKKRLNKKGQQAKKNINNAQRIDGEKTIYEVDGKVQVFSENECAEEAHIDGGVVTEETKVVDATNGDVIDAEYEEVDDYLDDEDEDDDIDVEEFGDIVEEDRFADEATVDDMDDEYDEDEDDEPPINQPRMSAAKKSRKQDELMAKAKLCGIADTKPELISVNSYGDKLINLVHGIKASADARVDADYERYWKSQRKTALSESMLDYHTIFSSEFVNWNHSTYNNATEMMDDLIDQYNYFIQNCEHSLNDPNVPGIYYCNNLRLLTSGCLMHTGSGYLPIKGRYADIRIFVPKERAKEFTEEYTTRVVLCHTSNQIKPQLMTLAAEGMAPIDGVKAYYVINMPKLLKLFEHERGHKTTYYCSNEGYTLKIDDYDDPDPTTLTLCAKDAQTSLNLGFMKAVSRIYAH